MANMNAWHMMNTEQICIKLETNAVKGLGKKQAVARAKKIAVRQPEALSPLFLPTRQPFYRDLLKLLLDPVMLLTLFVAILAFLFKEYALGSAVSVILLIGTLCCAIANNRARKVANHLQLYSNPMIKVIRSGKMYTTDARNVLPGDLIILTEGDICPADVRLEKGCSARVLQYQLKDSFLVKSCLFCCFRKYSVFYTKNIVKIKKYLTKSQKYGIIAKNSVLVCLFGVIFS